MSCSKSGLQLCLIRYEASVEAGAPNQSLTLRVNGPLRIAMCHCRTQCLMFIHKHTKNNETRRADTRLSWLQFRVNEYYRGRSRRTITTP